MANTTCSIKVSESTPFAKLADFVGADVKTQSAIFAKVTKGDKFTTEFEQWYQEKHDTDKVPNIETDNESEAKTLAKDVYEYYKTKRLSVSDTTRNEAVNTNVKKFGYTSTLERENGKKHAGTLVLDIFKKNQAAGVVFEDDKVLEHYRNELKKQWRGIIHSKISKRTGKKFADVVAEYKEAAKQGKVIAYYEENLGDDAMAKNVLAVYKELHASDATSTRYMEELLANKNLNPVLGVLKDEIEIEVMKYQDDNNSEIPGDENTMESDDMDGLDVVRNYDHSGMYGDFMMHVGPRITLYFNTLRKLNSANLNDFDNNNTYGLAETMDVKACCSMLYNASIFGNIDTMIKGIEDIANTIPGFEAFYKLAQDLRDDLDFATEMFTVFAKAKIKRLETIFEDGNTSSRISNTRADKVATMAFDILNDAKQAPTAVSANVASNFVRTITSGIRNIGTLNNKLKSLMGNAFSEAERKRDALLTDTIDNVIKYFRLYFPSLQTNAIKTYINLANNAQNTLEGKLKNINILKSYIKEIQDAVEKSDVLLSRMNNAIEEAKRNNKAVKEEAAQNQDSLDKSKLINTKALYSDEYTKPFNSIAGNLANILAPYSVVNTDINSRTIYGKNQSSIINSSHITNLNKMLDETFTEYLPDGTKRKRNLKLEAWGMEKLKSSQYKYSNILVEQVDEDGNVLNSNSALFRYVNGQLCLTDYVDEVLQFMQFSGSSNIDEGKNLSYSKMNFGDFLPTAYVNFFNSVNTRGNTVPTALYFLSTPSDAPNTFMMRAPRIDTSNIIKAKDEKLEQATATKIAEEVLNGTTTDNIDDFRDKYGRQRGNDTVVDKSYELRRIITAKQRLLVKSGAAIKRIGDVDENGSYEAYVLFEPTDAKDVIVALKGRIDIANNAEILNDISVDGTLYDATTEGYDTAKDILTEYYKAKLRNSPLTIKGTTYEQTELVVDTNHKMFKLFKNQFKQEMLDAATAIAHYFEVTDAKDANGKVLPAATNGSRKVVRLDDKTKKPVFRKDRSNTRGYQGYHTDSKTGLVYEDGKKNYKLEGKVFNSNKFTLTVDKDGVKTPINYLKALISTNTQELDDSLINFLYGGAMKLIMDGERVVDVEFSDAQNEAINEALSNFITDYIQQTTEVIRSKKDFIKGVSTSNENIIEYALNEYLTRFSYDDFLIGSSKFYKSTQDILKRAKEYQGSGVPYGIADYTSKFSPNLDPANNSFLNEGTIDIPVMVKVRQKDGTIVEKQKLDDKRKPVTKTVSVMSYLNSFEGLSGISQRNGFTGVTIANTIRTNEVVLKQLEQKLKDIGVAPDLAAELMWGPVDRIDKKTGEPIRKGGFTNTKVNDAQSYITYKEFVRRVAARGQLKKYLPLLEKINDRKAKLTGDDIKQFVQLQKNFYYDMYYDNDYGIYVPRQIKNAEFVLVPRLIEGTQLEDVCKAMEAAGVDQLNTKETSKAANEEILTLWDNDGNLSADNLKSFTEKATNNKQIFSYNNLYTQQETPQHMNAENKAGIQIMKKIIDNLPNDNKSKLGKLKSEYFRLFGANIEDSFKTLFDELNVPRDEKGNLILDEDGNIQGIDMEVFYDKLKDELMRTGMDSNAKDYVTLDGAMPIMPSYINNYLTKFESVVQSLFNSGITRQKLPGFHAGQVTQIGWRAGNSTLMFTANEKGLEAKVKETITLDEYEALSDEQKTYYDKIKNNIRASKDLKYHPNGDAYIEIMLPYSFLGIDKNSEHYKNMSDEEILDELAAEDKNGLDTVIGYRIPTEGKQSVCKMKVVGFISDAYGSTIVVPDDWVSQTGSDFDIDSVYGIQFETYKTADGQVKKVKYKDKLTIYDWFSYVNRYAKDTNLNRFSKGDVTKGLKDLRVLNQERFKEANEREQELWKDIDEDVREDVIKINKAIDAAVADDLKKGKITKAEVLQQRLNKVIDYYTQIIDKTEVESKKTIYTELLKVHKTLQSVLTNQNDNYTEADKAYIDKVLEEHKAEYAEAARKAGLLSLEEFLKPENLEKANGKKARNSRILDIMQEILESDECLEENLSRSNFDGITESTRATMNENVKIERENRSPYNPIDQFRFQEEAMSGATLKAFSVTLDTFCSICNTVRPTLSKPIYVVYNSDKYGNANDYLNKFGTVTESSDKIHFSIRHNKYGWSTNNRNVAGKLLTSYSSQTTAFILDAIKEGSIPGLNTYTFSAFKTLVNAGCDFYTAVSFIQQPGVQAIVDAYNSNNSVFSSSSGNVIHQAIENIAKQLDLEIKPYTSINTILSMVNKKYNKQFNKLFRQDGDGELTIGLKEKDTENLPLIVDKLVDRLHDTGEFKKSKADSSPVKKLLFDLGVVLAFNNLYNTANEIGDIARCCNPDKFGAKQSVYATVSVFDNIDKCIFNREEDASKTKFTKKERRDAVLTVGKEHILESIYPGVGNENYNVNDIVNHVATGMDVSKSTYRTLASFLKYSSSSSAIVARQVFETQNEQFVNLIKGFKSVLSGYNPIMKEETYVDVQRYVLSSIYNKTPSIAYPVKVRRINGEIELTHDVSFDVNDKLQSDRIIEDNERDRIYGYERPNGAFYTKRTIITDSKGDTVLTEQVPFEVKDFMNPTEEELEHYEDMSPAQKIWWLKNTLDDAGIFNLIDVALYNEYGRGKRAGMQTLEYNDQNINSNVVYSLFKEAFYNNNPLIVSAAIDIVKYAVRVEGLKMTAKAVNKIIDNDVLHNPFGKDGLGFVDYIRDEMKDIYTMKGRFNTTEAARLLYENYLRGHDSFEGIKTLYLSESNKKKYGLYSYGNGIQFIKRSNNPDRSAENNQKEFDKLLVNAGIKFSLPLSGTTGTNSYIRLKEKGTSTLYKIIDGGSYIMMFPLNNLETFENTEWSVNEDNNKYYNREVYEYIAAEYAKQYSDNEFTVDFINKRVEEFRNESDSDVSYIKRKQYKNAIPTDDFSIEDLAKEGLGSMAIARDNIIKEFTKRPSNAPRFFLNIGKLYDYIHTPGVEYASRQEINFGNGDKRQFLLYIPENIRKIEQAYLSKDIEGKFAKFDDVTSPSMKEHIRNSQGHVGRFAGLVEVVEDDGSRDQAHEEVNAKVIDFARSRTKVGDDLISAKLVGNWRNYGIGLDKESIKNNLDVSTREIAKYAKGMAENIELTCYRRFLPDPANAEGYLKITDDEVIRLMKESADIREKYISAYNLMQSFIDTFQEYRNFKSDNPTIQRNIEDIQKSVKLVTELPIADVLNKGIQTIVELQTTNPNIQQGLVDVMDGFWKTYGHMWKFNDMQENGNPVIQVILKDVMRDLDAKKKHFLFHTKKQYWKDIEALKKKAADMGLTIDIQKLIDEDGRFIQDYDSSFVDELNSRKDAVRDAAVEHGFGSIEHLRAKMDFDKFKAVYVNQAAKPEYYQMRALLEKDMIDNHPVIYEAYMKLFYERMNLYNDARRIGFTDDIKAKLSEVESKMYNLYSEGGYTNEAGEWVDRPWREENVTYSEDKEKELLLIGDEEASALSEFLSKTKKLNDEYFKYDAVYNFNEELKANLKIISDFESSGKPQSVLDSDPDYAYAKNWVRNNAKFVTLVTNANTGEPSTLMDKIRQALRNLYRGGNNKNRLGQQIIKDYEDINGISIYDEYGVPDGSKLSAEDVARIKQNTQDNYNRGAEIGKGGFSSNSDRILISNASPVDEVYTDYFYRRLRKDGVTTAEYLDIVTELNKYLEKYYDTASGIVDFSKIPATDEGIAELKAIGALYQKLRETTKRVDTTNGAEVDAWIKENVEFHSNEELFKNQRVAFKKNNEAYTEALLEVICDRNKDGDFLFDAEGKPRLNSFLYGYITPKGKPGEFKYDRFVDKQKKADMELVEKSYTKQTTSYYAKARNEALRKAESDPSFDFMNDWYIPNHVYNPYTRKMEPLSIWVESKLNYEIFGDDNIQGRWEPRSAQREKQVKDGIKTVKIGGVEQKIHNEAEDKRNKNYNEKGYLLDNYIKGANNGKFDSKVELNAAEKEMRDFLKRTLEQTAHVESARHYFRDGYLPKAHKAKPTDGKMIAGEFLKLLGIGISTNNGEIPFYKDIDYSVDETPVMPMTQVLNSKMTADISKKIKELEKCEPNETTQPNPDLLKEELKTYNARMDELKRQLKEEQNSLINRDWYNVIGNYLEQASNYNAVLENKQKLYFLLSAMRRMKMYSRQYGGSGELKKDTRRSSDDNTVYEQSIDKEVIEQLEDWIRRLLFDQWKESEGIRTKLANALQGFTSANYMMLNIRGGVANVTLGETAIFAEAKAKEHFSEADWAFGTKEWMLGSIGFARGGFNAIFENSGRAVNKQDAIIKFFNVVDYAERTGVVRELNLEEYSKKFRDFMFSPQTMGEHFMQNSVLFAMLHCHKIVYSSTGEPMIMNFNDYRRLRESELLSTLLDEEQLARFEEFKESIKADKNKLSKYAWFRRDALTDFVYLHCSKEQKDKFVKLRKEKNKEFETEFKEKKDVYSQLDLGDDGTMTFVPGSDLEALNQLDCLADTVGQSVTKAMYLLGEFSERVRKVNNKIHGVYNRMGAAAIEKKWYGSLVMQYHKHLPIGLLKRYRARGHWDETRGTVEKGMIQSIADIANLNYRKLRVEAGLSEEAENALKGFTFLATNLFDYFTQLRETLEVCPIYDKANALRNLGDAVGVVGAMCTVAAMWYLADIDKNVEDSLAFNFFLYEADRLASEAFLYNPVGLVNESKKLMSTPIAAQSIITDAMSSLAAVINWMFDEDFDPYYHSGRFAGEAKLSVYVQRRIPIWNGIRGFLDTPDNNHYYKLGQNPIGMFNIKEAVTGKQD